jgi:5-methylcytosine-specific restriction endonuclease McrA
MADFCEVKPSLENYWRGIILFGLNSASYKFALAKSLLDLSDQNSTFVTLEELAGPFSRHLATHVAQGSKQGTSRSNSVIETCKKFIAGELTDTALAEYVAKHGFNDVIDRFHIVNRNQTPIRFYHDERDGSKKGIRLTDEIYRLRELPCSENFELEVEARWRLVETAWELKVSANLLTVRHDPDTERLFVDEESRRKDVTSCRDAMNGYQKGKCFYCYDDISVQTASPHMAEVDHFFPHLLKGQEGIYEPIDGVWNLVLACSQCNGMSEKGTKVPTLKLLQRLNTRNEYLIASNHPLKETIINQTGNSSEARGGFLNGMWKKSVLLLLFKWEPEAKGDSTF